MATSLAAVPVFQQPDTGEQSDPGRDPAMHNGSWRATNWTLLGPITLSATTRPKIRWVGNRLAYDGTCVAARMVNTLAKAGAARTGVLEAEIDVLRVYLDTARYQALAQHPDVDAALLLNTFLLAVAEGIATGDLLSANYHFCWFRTLSAPPASKWASNS